MAEGTKDVSKAQFRTDVQTTDGLLMVNPITKEVQQVKVGDISTTVEAEVMVKVDEKVATAIAGEKGSVNTKTVPSTITVNGVYRASEAGDYKNLKAGLVAKLGWSTWFEKKGSAWSLYSEVNNNISIANTGGASTTIAIAQKFATDTQDSLTEQIRVANTMDCIVSAKMDGALTGDFNTYRKRAASLSVADRDKYLFPSLMYTTSNELVGVRMTDGATIKLPFKRASKDIGLIDGKITLVDEDIPVQNRFDKITCIAPEKENLGVNYNNSLLGGRGVNQTTYPSVNILRGDAVDTPLKDKKGLRFTKLALLGVTDVFLWGHDQFGSIENKRFVFSIYVRGKAGERFAFYMKRFTGPTSNNKYTLHTFSGQWERVQIIDFIGLRDQFGLQCGISKVSTSTDIDEFDVWAPQIEEVVSRTDESTNPIFYPTKSNYQLDFNLKPFDPQVNVMFSSECYYDDSLLLDNQIVRTQNGKSGKFFFKQDSGVIRRAECRGNSSASNKAMWYSGSVYFPSSYLQSAGSEIFMQWRDWEDNCDFKERSPSISIMTTGNNITVGVRWDSRKCMPNNIAEGSEVHTLVENFDREKWHDFIYRIRWDYTGNNSYLQIWHRVDSDDPNAYKLVLDRVNKPLGYNDDNLPNHKFGIYRWDNFVGADVTSRTLYHAEVKCWIDDGSVPISKLHTGEYDLEALKLKRAAASVDTTGLNIIDPTGKKEYFWAY